LPVAGRGGGAGVGIGVGVGDGVGVGGGGCWAAAAAGAASAPKTMRAVIERARRFIERESRSCRAGGFTPG
jgi:hypothetical protein